MFNLTKVTTDNIIEIIGIILTIITITISIWQVGKTINHSLVEARQQMALEQTGELPLQVAEFCSAASNVATGIVLGQDQMTDEQKEEFNNSKQRQNKLQPMIKNRIYAYGSNDAIKIYTQFEKTISNPNGNQISVDAYYILPLLLAQVKMDVTGETVNPLIFFNSLMPQFKEHSDKAKAYINEMIDELKLDNDLRIN